MTTRIKSPRKRTRTVKQRTNGKHKIDAASTISAPLGGGLSRILRPQALFRWLGPQLAAITPTYIEQTMLGAMQGSTIQAWSLFDIMLKSWPELLACYRELVESVIRKKLVYEPYCEEDEKPSYSAQERMKVVATALRRMEPDPARDDSNIEGTIRDILDAWFRGVAVSEIIWQTIEDKQVGTITAPKSTFAVDPTNYAYATDGSLGLRTDKSRDTGVWPYSSTTLNPQPSQLTPFSRYENKFLIAMHKASGGSPLGGALLRPLAWWWCAANFSSDWLLNLAQVFGLPFRWASYDSTASTETLATLDNMLQNMGSNGWARFPAPTTLEFVEMGKQGSDHSPQGELLDRADRYARSLILGQTMTGNHGTTGKGGGQAFGTVEESVKSDRIDAAGKFAVTVINQQLVPSILMLNFGNTDEMPTLKFLEDEVADLSEAQRDKTLADAGLEIGVDYLRKKYDIPEPADGEDTIGGEKPMPDFGNQFGGSFGEVDGTGADKTDEPPSDEPAKASDQTGHPFRGNQYVEGQSDVKISESNGSVMIKSPKGYLELKHSGDTLTVREAHVDVAHIGTGEGSKLYRSAFDYAQKHDLKLQSSHAVSESADRVWQSLQNRGYPIDRAPNVELDPSLRKFYAVDYNRGLKIRNGRPIWKMRNAELQTKLLELNAIEDDAVFARELLALAAGDKPGHPFHGNQWTSGIDNESAHPTHPLPDKSKHGKAVYTLKNQKEGDLDTMVERKPDGSYYAMADNFDFDAPSASAMRERLKKYGARYVGWENK